MNSKAARERSEAGDDRKGNERSSERCDRSCTTSAEKGPTENISLSLHACACWSDFQPEAGRARGRGQNQMERGRPKIRIHYIGSAPRASSRLPRSLATLGLREPPISKFSYFKFRQNFHDADFVTASSLRSRRRSSLFSEMADWSPPPPASEPRIDLRGCAVELRSMAGRSRRSWRKSKYQNITSGTDSG